MFLFSSRRKKVLNTGPSPLMGEGVGGGVQGFIPPPCSSPTEGCVVIASGGERQSGSKALEECGSFRLWEIVAYIKSNVFIRLAHLNPSG